MLNSQDSDIWNGANITELLHIVAQPLCLFTSMCLHCIFISKHKCLLYVYIMYKVYDSGFIFI